MLQSEFQWNKSTALISFCVIDMLWLFMYWCKQILRLLKISWSTVYLGGSNRIMIEERGEIGWGSESWECRVSIILVRIFLQILVVTVVENQKWDWMKLNDVFSLCDFPTFTSIWSLIFIKDQRNKLKIWVQKAI